MMKPKHILWDWNGTLLDDVPAALSAINEMLRRRGLKTIDRDTYRANFGFPVRNFYIKLGFQLQNEDWDQLAIEYHDLLRGSPLQKLQEDAIESLEMARNLALGQSIISALRQDYLDIDTEKSGVRSFMDKIYGVDNLDGATKLSRALELMDELKLESSEMVVIGDTLHDLEISNAIGAACILVNVGHQQLKGRVPAGIPVADSLCEAIGKLR